MKKSRILLCVLLALVTVVTAVFVSFGYRAAYELADGAAIFNSPASHQYFAKSNLVNNLNLAYDAEQNAEVMQVNTASDPYALLSYKKLGVTNLSADAYKYIAITYKVPSTVSAAATTMEVFYCAGSITAPTGGKSVTFALTKDNAFHTHIIDMSGVSGWSGTIHSLRLDCFTSASVGDVMYLDSVILAKTATEANQIAAYRSDKANGRISDGTAQVIFDADNYDEYLKVAGGASELLGDINLDGQVTTPDYRLIRKYLVCVSITETFSEKAADINKDGMITIKDSLLIKKTLLGLINPNEGNSGPASVIFDSTSSKAKLTALSSAPYVYMTYEPVTDDTYYAGQFKYAVITYMSETAGTAEVIGITSQTGEESSAVHSFTVKSDGKYHSEIINFTDDEGWVGKIDSLRINFFTDAEINSAMYLDSVTLTENINLATVSRDYREAVANGYEFANTYTLDITGQTLGQINTSGTWQNVGEGDSVFAPFSAAWPAAGYPTGAQDTLLAMRSYNNYIKVADCVDLSKYDSVTVTYSTDKSFSTTSSTFGFFSVPKIYGQGSLKDTANLIFDVYLKPADSTKTSWKTLRTSTASINSSYCGPLYLSYYMATGDGAVITDITFHLKTPSAVIPDTLNNSKGDTVYTVSGTGDTITADGVTYPNGINYTSGVTVATDDIDRELTVSDTQNLNGGVGGYDFADKNVGMFYFLWLGAHGTAFPSGGADIQKIVNTHGAIPGSDSRWLGNGIIHYFFSEPLYGYYDSDDVWVIRKHIEELTNADVDFIFFDVTNGVAYIDTAKKVMSVIHEFNQMGYDPPKVVFYTNISKVEWTDNKTMMQYLYDTIYAPGYLPDTWFYYLGKPVIIGKQTEYNNMSATARNFFTFRQSQWPNEEQSSSGGYKSGGYYKKDGGWAWMDFTDLPSPNRNPAGTAYEAINVSIAQHLGTIAFGDSGIYEFNIMPESMGGKFRFSKIMNHGRNWNGTYNDDKGGYAAGNCLEGYNFQRQWDTVHDTYNDELPVVLVTGWNEWAAGKIEVEGSSRSPSGYDMAQFVDTATVNYSRDIEMTRGYYFDSYYMQLINNVRKYKGASPALIRNTRKRIDINASFDQWNDITASYRDATGETAARNAVGFGNITYKNTTGRNDIRSAKIVYDTEYIYFYVECASNITAYNTSSSWMQLFIDADISSDTGWYGYDYIVNYKAQGSGRTSIARSNSNDAYSFEIIDSNLEYRVSGNMMMVKVPLSDLGITDYNNITFSFKWGDSTSVYNTMEKMYTDGDVMPLGRLNYIFTNVELQ